MSKASINKLTILSLIVIIFIGGSVGSTLPLTIYGLILVLLGKSELLSTRVDGVNFWDGIWLVGLSSLLTSAIFAIIHLILVRAKTYKWYQLMLTSGIYFWVSFALKSISNEIGKLPLYLLSIVLLAIVFNILFFRRDLFMEKDDGLQK